MAGHKGGSASRMRQPYMIVSIDFGTTFSGVCWTWSGDLSRVHPIQSWDEVGSAKIPTKIQYNGDQPVTWGYEVDDPNATIEWFKLILDWENLPPTIKMSPRVHLTYDKLKRLPFYNGSSEDAAMKVATDYLQLLWERAVKHILEKEGQTWAHGMPCKVVITRPAIWSQQASNRTLRAARDAILPNSWPFESVEISTISEPEAAAHAVLQAPAVAGRSDLTNPGDVYVICDAGGGTVDVITYIVQSLTPMRLGECVEGKGELCGAVFLDDEFEGFLRTQLGPQRISRLAPDQYRRLMINQWERGIKRQFDSTKASAKWMIDVPGGRSYAFNRDEMEVLFQPTCSKARGLIWQQVKQVREKYNKSPKAILLVGGYGSSRYLSHVLKKEYRDEIEIRHSLGDDTWNAVCRGAVMATVEDVIVSRISRLHYGFSFDVPYDPKSLEHRGLDIDRVKWDKPEQKNMVTGRMEWLVKRGAKIAHIRASPCYTAKQYIKYPEQLAEGKIASELWVCGDAEAPRWKGSNVRLLCTIIANLDASFHQLPSYVNRACDTYRVVEIDIVMCPNGNTLDFSIRFEGRQLDFEIEWPDNRHNSRNIALDAMDI